MMLKSSFAAITRDNIKLVYLRRSLLQKLSKDKENFEQRVKGSFVLHWVKKRKLNGRLYLRLSNTENMFCIDSLSDSDVEEAECLDLMQKVKSGLIQKPTIFQLQEKAKSLHIDIKKHWIDRDLWLLGKKITKACKRGQWLRLNKLLRKQKLLLDRSEQLHQRQPIVKAEELEPITEEEEEPAEPVSGTPTAAMEMDKPANVTSPPVSTGTRRGKKRRNTDTPRRRGDKRQTTGAGTSRGPPQYSPRDDDGENVVGGWSRVPPPHPFAAFVVSKRSLIYSYARIADALIPLEFGQFLDVLLRLSEGGKEWPVIIAHDGRCLRMNGAGWKSFAQENLLQAGNACFFQWHRDSKTFTVHIYR